MFAVEDFEGGQGGGTAQGVAGVGVAVEKGGHLGVVTGEDVEYGLSGQSGGHGEIASGQAFGHCHEVGLDRFLLGCEHGSGAAETGGHFVADEQNVVFATESLDTGEVALWLDEHAGGALDEGLDDQGGDVIGFFLQQVGKGGEAVIPAGFWGRGLFASIPVRSRDAMDREEEGPEDFVEQGDSSDAH